MRSDSADTGLHQQTDELLQFVTFVVNDELFAIDAVNVKEIIKLTSITTVPHLPPFLRGVINLRGTIIPVMDLKLKLGMKGTPYARNACIVVIEVSFGIMGFLIDSIADVVHFTEGQISDTPSFGPEIKTEYIKGIGNAERGLIIILNVERLLSDAEIKLLSDPHQYAERDQLRTRITSETINTLTFSIMRNDHLIMASRLSAYIDGRDTLSEDHIMPHNDCDLGRWLSSEGIDPSKHMKEVSELDRAHRDFHEIFNSTCELVHVGQRDSAREEYHKILPLCGRLSDLIDSIREGLDAL